MTTTPPPTRAEWVSAFVNELVRRRRPDIGLIFATVIARSEYVRQMEKIPEKAAADWAKRSAAAQ